MKNKERILIIFRHGEMCHQNGLTPLGDEQVQKSAKLLRKNEVIPDFMIASSSDRTLKTAHIITEEFNHLAGFLTCDMQAKIHKTFVGVDLKEILTNAPENVNCILLSAHHETITEFACRHVQDAELFHLLNSVPKSQLTVSDKWTSIKINTADALILKQTDKNQPWKFDSWLDSREQKIYKKSSKKNCLPIGMFRKYSPMKFPCIIYDHH